MNISVPEELADEVRKRDLPISTICQEALVKAVTDDKTKERLMTDMTAVIERLRGTMDEEGRKRHADGREDGVQWAKEYATASELEHMSSYDGSGGDFEDHSLLAFLGGKDGQMYVSVRVDLEDRYWEGFIDGAASVWAYAGPRLNWKGPVTNSRDW